MTKPNDSHNVISYLTAFQHLRESEQRQGIEPLERGENCPTPHEMMSTIVGQAPAERMACVEKHVADCMYCGLVYRSLKAFLNDEPLPELPEDDEDPLGGWSEEDERARRPPAPVPAVSGDTKARADTSLGFTQMASDPQLWPRLIEELRPWVRPLLRKAGLDVAWAHEFLAYVEAQLPSLGRQRFTPMLDRCFQEFARTRDKTPTWRIATATLRDLDSPATEIVLNEPPAAEPEKVTQLRKAGIAKESITRSDLLNLSFDEDVDNGWVTEKLREWYFQAGARLQRARELFEVG